MGKRVLFISLFLIFALISTPVQAATTPPKPRQDVLSKAPINLTVFAPAKIKISYDYTKNVTISNVTCVGPSLYEVTTSPIDLTFQALNIDDYSFTLDLKYDSVITQDVKVTFISGSQPPSTYTIPAYCNHLVFPIIIKAAHEPHYPTAEEIAGAVVEQISARLDVYNANLQQILHSVMDGLNNQSMVLVVITLGVLITAAFLYRNLRSQKPKVEEEGEEPKDDEDDV
jgi:hypothetical protein